MNKLFGLAGVALLLVGVGILGYAFNKQSDLLGATINYSNSLSQVNLYNSLEGIVDDLEGIRRPFSNVSSTSATLDFPALGPIGTTTSTAVTSTAFTGAAIGDFVLVSNASATEGVSFVGSVNAADNISIVAANASTSVINPGAQLFRFRLLPQASFARPDALVSVTSTAN